MPLGSSSMRDAHGIPTTACPSSSFHGRHARHGTPPPPPSSTFPSVPLQPPTHPSSSSSASTTPVKRQEECPSEAPVTVFYFPRTPEERRVQHVERTEGSRKITTTEEEEDDEEGKRYGSTTTMAVAAPPPPLPLPVGLSWQEAVVFGDRWAGFTDAHRRWCAVMLHAPYFIHDRPTEAEDEGERKVKHIKTEHLPEGKEAEEPIDKPPTPPAAKGEGEEAILPREGSDAEDHGNPTETHALPIPPLPVPTREEMEDGASETTSKTRTTTSSFPTGVPRTVSCPGVFLPSAEDASPTATVIATASPTAGCCLTVLLWRDTTLWEMTFHTLYRIRRTLDASFHHARWRWLQEERHIKNATHHRRTRNDPDGEKRGRRDGRGRHRAPSCAEEENEEPRPREGPVVAPSWSKEDVPHHSLPSSSPPLSLAVDACVASPQGADQSTTFSVVAGHSNASGDPPVEVVPSTAVGHKKDDDDVAMDKATIDAWEASPAAASSGKTSDVLPSSPPLPVEKEEMEVDEEATEKEAYEKDHVARYQLHWWAGALCAVTARPRFHFLGSVLCESVLPDHPMVIPVRRAETGREYPSGAEWRKKKEEKGRANRHGKFLTSVGIPKALETPVVDIFTYPGLGAPLFVYPERLQ